MADPVPPPLRGYAICTEQRSGSSYLCQLLASTGVLGRPIEYFNGAGMATFQPDYPRDPEAQLREITRQGATANGIYGVKLFSGTFDRFAPKGWAERLPELRFISLVRHDVLGQAISLTRLAQTNQYSADAMAVGEPFYDADRIASEIQRLALGQARWSAFFARCGVSPLHLDYDTIAADPQGTVEKVAHFMGLDERPVVDLQQVHTRVQRDTVSEAWRTRFVAEARDLSFLDTLSPPRLPTRLLRAVRRKMRGKSGDLA